MAHEKLRPEYFFDAEKIAQLKQIAPECFEDGKINFETLRENLGDWTQNEEDPELEHFGLFWPGKRDARKAAALPPEGTLEPVWGDGLKADGTPDKEGSNDSKNIFIEGENLEVLKLLQKSYTNKIKLIYIDPPYNTGNDFVYDDDFTEPLQEYLRRTGQVDEEGKTLTTNKRGDGRFHSKWLSMMYPRLRLARNLLKEDGVIFISIDDNEVHNLKAICNEIFGEENFLAQIVWERSFSPVNLKKHFSENHDFILCFSKNAHLTISNGLKRSEEADSRYSNPDNDPRGNWTSSDMTVGPVVEDKLYPIITPKGKELKPSKGRCWLFTKEKYEEMVKDNRIWFGESGENMPRVKKFLSEVKDSITPLTIWKYSEVGHSQDAAQSLKKLFDGASYFDFPKPVGLIKRCLELYSSEDDIILDFFAGSGTTAQAVYELNINDKRKRKTICVQIPAPVEENSEAYKDKYKTIADITKERIRRSSKLYMNKSTESNNYGFKVFSLGFSNFKKWKNLTSNSVSELESKLSLFNENPLREDYKKDGLLTEIILLEGFTLCSEISKLKEIKSNSINKITSEYCMHSLLICLDEKVKKETIESIDLGDNDIFICLDSAISTEDKLRLSDKGLIKTI